MELRHNVRDGISNAWDFCERASRDDAVERLGKSREGVCSAQEGFRTVGIAASERGALRIFPEGGGQRFECRFLPWLPRQTGAVSGSSRKQRRKVIPARDIYIPDLHIDTLNVKARNFR